MQPTSTSVVGSVVVESYDLSERTMANIGGHHQAREIGDKIGDVEIVSAVSGRVRLRVKDQTSPKLLDALARHFQGQTGLDEVRTNPDTGSLTVRFDPDLTTISQLLEPLQLPAFGNLPAIEARADGVPAIRPQDIETALDRLQSFVPPLLGLAIVRALRLYGWTAIPAYLLATGLTRQAVKQIDFDLSALFLDRDDTVFTNTALTNSLEPSRKPETLALAEIVVHDVPGRLRLRLPRVAEDAAYVKRLERLATAEDSITSVRINPASSSVTVTYPSETPSSEMRLRMSRLLIAAEMPKSLSMLPKSNISSSDDSQDDTDDRNGRSRLDRDRDIGESNHNRSDNSPSSIELENASNVLSKSDLFALADLPEDNTPKSSWSQFKSSAMSVFLNWMAQTPIGAV